MKNDNHHLRRLVAMVAVMTVTLCAAAESEFGCDVSLTGNFGKGEVAPSYLMANNHGILSQPAGGLARVVAGGSVWNDHNFAFCFGVDVIGAVSKSTDYNLYDAATSSFNPRAAKQAPVWLQQLYGELSYRSLFLSLGMKEHYSVLLNQKLSSGDLCFSGNTRPMPGLAMGFVDFQNIPFTNGWVQINGEIGYYKTLDKKWMENRYNYYNYFITTDYIYHYKYLHLRTNPDKPFSLTIGMQTSCQIGGTNRTYKDGVNVSSVKSDIGIKDIIKAFIPGSGGGNSELGDQAYYLGNHVGTWDVMGRYRFNSGDELRLYYQSPWEDGSGIGKLNGFDGLYGIEYSRARQGIVDCAVLEYIDLMNQSGPIHWAPGDHVGEATTIPSNATGSDDYYNNYNYNGYQYFGQTIGSPLVRSSMYNYDGYLRITDNRIRGFHAAVSGHFSSNLSYRAKLGYRYSLGTPFLPLVEKRSTTSFMVEGRYDFRGVDGLSITAKVGGDFGKLLGNNFGALVSVKYSGLFNF